MSGADENEWITWGGGDCPVDPTDNVEVKLRNGMFSSAAEAWTFSWVHMDDDAEQDIIAYRVIP